MQRFFASTEILFRRNQIIVHRLAAAEQIYIRIGADFSKDIGSLLGVLFLHIVAVVDGVTL